MDAKKKRFFVIRLESPDTLKSIVNPFSQKISFAGVWLDRNSKFLTCYLEGRKIGNSLDVELQTKVGDCLNNMTRLNTTIFEHNFFHQFCVRSQTSLTIPIVFVIFIDSFYLLSKEP